jgi:PASTA domain
VDDEFGLLPDQQGAPPPPRRPMGLVLGGLVLVALAAVAAVFWLVASLAHDARTVTAAGTPSPAATATPTPVATTPPVTTTPPTTVAPSTLVPVRSATTIVPTRTAPKPTPAPTTRPVPGPTPSVPVGRLVRVPDVVGLRVQQADAVLRAAGLRVQVIGGVLDAERDDRRIVAQRPTAGSLVLAGSTVILVTDGT